MMYQRYYQPRRPARRRPVETIALDEYLALVVLEAREHGYVSAKQAEAQGIDPTHKRAWTRRGDDAVRDQDREYANAVERWAIGEFLEPRQLGRVPWGDDYAGTCATILAARVVNEFTRGFAASLVAGAERAVQEAQERAKNPNPSQHIGDLKQRLDLVVEITGIKPGNWGELISARTQDGNVVKWYGEASVAVGQWASIRGTVKSHGVWRGVNETMLNRVTVQDAGPVPEHPSDLLTVFPTDWDTAYQFREIQLDQAAEETKMRVEMGG